MTTPFIRDQLVTNRINRIKRRVKEHAARQAHAQEHQCDAASPFHSTDVMNLMQFLRLKNEELMREAEEALAGPAKPLKHHTPRSNTLGVMNRLKR